MVARMVSAWVGVVATNEVDLAMMTSCLSYGPEPDVINRFDSPFVSVVSVVVVDGASMTCGILWSSYKESNCVEVTCEEHVKAGTEADTLEEDATCTCGGKTCLVCALSYDDYCTVTLTVALVSCRDG